MKAKILIVGGGAMGTCAALHTAKHCDSLREPVVLIERDELGAGSSGRTSAIVHQSFSDRVMAGMSRDALKVYSGMKAATGRSVGYRKTGALVIAGSNTAAVEQLEADIEMQQGLAINVQRVGPEEMRQLFPSIEVSDDCVGAWQSDGGFLDPKRTIQVFATLARERGVATRVGVHNPKLMLEGGRVVGVETDSGLFEAENVVFATGAWTHTMLRDYGIDLPMKVLKTRESFLEMPPPDEPDEDDLLEASHSDIETRFFNDPLDSVPVPHPVLIDLERDFQARCDPARLSTRVEQLGIGEGEAIETPDGLAEEEEREFGEWARGSLASRLPVYRDQEDKGTHTAWVTVSPDGVPVVGAVESIPGLYVMTGFSGRDFHLAPSIGEGMAQLVMGQPVSAFDVETLSPKRFL